ncbi:MAG: MXAN_6640 family putative metalloprotease [Candidatus Zhuqueibacterota bacterium]
MKRIFKFSSSWIILFLFIHSAHSQDMQSTISSAYARGELTHENYLVYSALSLFDPSRLPQTFQAEPAAMPYRGGTRLIQEIKANWDKLSITAQTTLSGYMSRPVLPKSYISPGGQFCIHYTTEPLAYGAVDPADANKNGVPDFVDSAAGYFDYAHDLIVNQLGFNSPPADSGGTGNQFDVYIINMSDYGITWLEQSVPGKPGAYSCYIEIDNDYRHVPTAPMQALAVTAAHEYFHVVQVGYRYRDNDAFFMEMCSTWMEDYAYDNVNDYLYYLDSFFKDINYPFYFTNNNYEYANSIWLHMIVKKYNTDFIRNVWESIPEQTAFTSIQQALLYRETNFQTELKEYGLWNYLTGSRADTLHYYAEGNTYPEVNCEKDLLFQNQNINLDEQMRKLSSIHYSLDDPFSKHAIGLIITNFEIPDANYLKTDFASFAINIVALSEDHLDDPNFFIDNNLVKLNNHIGIRLNVEDQENWFARAVVTDADNNHEIIQFYPPYVIDGDQNKNFIENIYPSPFLLNENRSLTITYVVTEEKAGQIAIFSSDGRLMTQTEFDPPSYNYRIFEWDGRNQNGDPVSSGVYLALLRVGDTIDMKKFAIVKE